MRSNINKNTIIKISLKNRKIVKLPHKKEKITMNSQKNVEQDRNKPDSKPEKLAKLIYGAIVRYIRAKTAQTRAENAKFVLDSSRERSVNVVTKEID
jgi:hypothetical protein